MLPRISFLCINHSSYINYGAQAGVAQLVGCHVKLVWFLVRAHAWIGGLIPGRWCARGSLRDVSQSHRCLYLLSSCLSKKSISYIIHSYIHTYINVRAWNTIAEIRKLMMLLSRVVTLKSWWIIECSAHSLFYFQLSLIVILVFGVKQEIPGLAPDSIILSYYYYHISVWLLIGLISRQMLHSCTLRELVRSN